MGSGAQYLGIPGFGVQGDLGAYWAHSAQLNRFDARSYRRQVATFCQLAGFLMTSDLRDPQSSKVDRPAYGAGGDGIAACRWAGGGRDAHSYAATAIPAVKVRPERPGSDA
jgi:hypothetical protein